MSMAAVPPPPSTNGWLAGSADQTRRIRSSASPKAAINAGAVCPGGATENASRTRGETSTGPGIIRMERWGIAQPPRRQRPRRASGRDQTIDQPQRAVDAEPHGRQRAGVDAEQAREERRLGGQG